MKRRTIWKPGPAIEVNTEALVEAIGRVAKFVGRKAPIHFKVYEEYLHIYAWDGASKGVTAYCAVFKGFGRMSFCLDQDVAKTHFSIRPFGTTILRLDTAWVDDRETSGHRIHAAQSSDEGTTEFDISVKDSADPEHFFHDIPSRLSVRANELRSALSMACAIANSADNGAVQIYGAKRDGLSVCATNKKDFFQAQIQGGGNIGYREGQDFSPKSIAALVQALDSLKDSAVLVHFNAFQLQICTEVADYTIVPLRQSSPFPTLKLIAGAKEDSTSIGLNRPSFLSMVRASACASEAEGGALRPISLSIESDEIGVLISGMNLNCPSYVRSSVPIRVTPGNPSPSWISLSPAILLPVLSEIGSPDVTIIYSPGSGVLELTYSGQGESVILLASVPNPYHEQLLGPAHA